MKTFFRIAVSIATLALAIIGTRIALAVALVLFLAVMAEALFSEHRYRRLERRWREEHKRATTRARPVERPAPMRQETKIFACSSCGVLDVGLADVSPRAWVRSSAASLCGDCYEKIMGDGPVRLDTGGASNVTS